MAQVITPFAKQSWTKGERFWEGSVPVAVEAVRVAIDRTSFSGEQIPDAIKVDAWVSQDGGSSWAFICGVGIPLGEAVIKGSVRSESGMQVRIPGVGNAQRRARIRYSVEAAAADTKLTVTLLP